MRQKGFTLIELIVTVAIIGILMMMAYPSYRKYMIRMDFASVLNGEANFLRKALVNNLTEHTELGTGAYEEFNKLGATMTETCSSVFTDDGHQKILTYQVVASKNKAAWQQIFGTELSTKNGSKDIFSSWTLTDFTYGPCVNPNSASSSQQGFSGMLRLENLGIASTSSSLLYTINFSHVIAPNVTYLDKTTGKEVQTINTPTVACYLSRWGDVDSAVLNAAKAVSAFLPPQCRYYAIKEASFSMPSKKLMLLPL